MADETTEHWDRVYATKANDAVSWYRPHLDLSLALIERSGQRLGARTSTWVAVLRRWWTTSCSGLEVARYSADGIHAEFGASFEKVGEETEVHTTPWGAEQQFVYCFCRVI